MVARKALLAWLARFGVKRGVPGSLDHFFELGVKLFGPVLGLAQFLPVLHLLGDVGVCADHAVGATAFIKDRLAPVHHPANGLVLAEHAVSTLVDPCLAGEVTAYFIHGARQVLGVDAAG